jgi:hypothetical protein
MLLLDENFRFIINYSAPRITVIFIVVNIVDFVAIFSAIPTSTVFSVEYFQYILPDI